MTRAADAGDEGQPSVLDLSLKAIGRRAPAAFLALAGVKIDPGAVHAADVSVVLPEFRADQVFLIGATDDPERWGVHFEYQAQPDVRLLSGWALKNAALNRQLHVPVFLIAIYVQKGDRAHFFDSYTLTKAGLINEYRFNAVRLWEHGDRIRAELPELAPLLVLCEERPTEATIREEIALIRASAAPGEVRADLLSVAYMVGTRFFLRSVLNALFAEELPMLKDAGIIGDWIEEGEARGRAEATRRLTLRLLRSRFGDLPSALVERIAQAEPEWCEELVERAMQSESLDELSDV